MLLEHRGTGRAKLDLWNRDGSARIIVNVDVSPPVINEPAFHHGIGGGFNVFGGNRVRKTIPTIPAHRRRQGDFVANNNFEFRFALPRAFFVP